MSSEHSADPPSSVPQSDSGTDERQAQRLAAQAHAAAEQALQLARLAQESAELARKLNTQVLKQTGQPACDLPAPPLEPAVTSQPPEVTSVTLAPLVSGAVEPWQKKVRGRGRTATGRRRLERLASTGRPTDHSGPTEPVHIKVRPQDRQRLMPARVWYPAGRDWKSILISTSLHALVLVLLGVITFGLPQDPVVNTVIASFAQEESELPKDEVVVTEDIGEQQEQPTPEEEPPPEQPPESPPEPMPQETQPDPPSEELARAEVPAPASPGEAAPQFEAAKLSNRSGEAKAYLLERYGGSAASESAVGRAFDWFTRMQRRDGSWNFNDVGNVSDVGEVDSPMGGTSYVLLCFLGAGHTHQQGLHQEVVKRGINYLLQNGRTVPAGGDFRGRVQEEKHNFYVQGAATMALAEAASMTGDRRLHRAAQAAARFIINAQDPVSGGWRYEPRSTGCTSVTALQMLALKSAEHAGVQVPPKVLDGISHFLNTVKCDREPTGRYSYQAESLSFNSPSTSQALLCRMYLGATRDDADLEAGVALLDDKGPYTNRYFCYYATQVMKNWGGQEWERWNESMREELLRTQVIQDGPELGSWPTLDKTLSSVQGGRLFNTCLCTMTLEVYYRYAPWDESLADVSRPAEGPATN